MLTDDDRAALAAMAARSPDDPELSAALSAAAASDKSRRITEHLKRIRERTTIR